MHIYMIHTIFNGLREVRYIESKREETDESLSTY